MQLLSRPLNDVATSCLHYCCRDLCSLSRPSSIDDDVATVSRCRDINVQCIGFTFVATSEQHMRHHVLFVIKLHLRLELCCRNLNMHFDCCKGFTISNPLIFFFAPLLLQPPSASYISTAQPSAAPFIAKNPSFS